MINPQATSPRPTRADVESQCERSVGEMFAERVRRTPGATAFLVPDRRAAGRATWTPHTWAQTEAEVHVVAAGLLSLGLEPEQRVAIASTTRHEWIIADLAIACAGGATTTIYPNTTSTDVLFITKDSDSRILIAENQAQAAKVQDVDAFSGQISTIVLFDDDRQPVDRVDQRVITWADLHDLGRRRLAADPDAVVRSIAATTPDMLSTLIYTSGTTGQPKGVELTHEALTYQSSAMDSLHVIDEHSVQYLWLPLSHVFGKVLIAIQVKVGFCTAVDGRIDRIVEGLGEVHPTFMCGAPRIFEKVRAAVLTANPRNGIAGRIARWAFSVGRRSIPYRLEGRPMPKGLAARYAVADRLVFSKLKQRMGGNIEFFISGSAKLSSQVQEWFYAAGIVVTEGYGLTETTAIAFLNEPRTPRFGTVGQVAPGIDVRIADDGEVLLRGPIIARGYHNQPEATADAFSDGWFHTGDIGEFDADDHLRITERKKDLIKTSGGKYVAPQKVEAAIAANIPYISQAIALGEGRKYIVALITLDPVALRRWGERHGHADLDYAVLSRRPEIRRSIERYMEVANSHLERWETVKRFAILDHEFSVHDGGVTPNMKVRRTVVANKYAHIVDSLYDKEPGEDAQ